MDFSDFADAAIDSLETQSRAWDDLVFNKGLSEPADCETLLHSDHWKKLLAGAQNPFRVDIKDWDFLTTDQYCRLVLSDSEKEIVEDFDRLPTFLVSMFDRFPAFRRFLAAGRRANGLDRTRSFIWDLWLRIVTRPLKGDIGRLRAIFESEYIPLKQAKPLIRALQLAGKTPAETARILAPVVYKLGKALGKKPHDAVTDGLYGIWESEYEKDNTYIQLKHTAAFTNYENFDSGATSFDDELKVRPCSNAYVSSLFVDGMTLAGLLHMDSSMIHFEGLLVGGELKVCQLWFTCLARFLKHVTRVLREPSILPEEVDLKLFQAHLQDIVPGLQAHHHLLQHVPRIESGAFETLEKADTLSKMVQSHAWHDHLKNNIHEDFSKKFVPGANLPDTISLLPPAAINILSRLNSKNDHWQDRLNSRRQGTPSATQYTPRWPEDVELSLAGEPIGRNRVRLTVRPGHIVEPVVATALLPDLQGRRLLVEEVNKLACWVAQVRGEAAQEISIEQDEPVRMTVVHSAG